MKEIHANARERVKSRCRVCPRCDGRACAGEIPGMGGMGTGASFHNNIKALDAHRLVMRVLHDANEPDCTSNLWGRSVDMPVFAAPIGNVGTNLGSDMSDAQYVARMLKGCVASGVMGSVGDTAKMEQFYESLQQINGYERNSIVFVKPWSQDELARRFDAVAETGCRLVGMDLDAAGLTVLRVANVPVRVKTPHDLALAIKLAHDRDMKFIAKGIMSPDEARVATDMGADAVLVSNHGGRVLDYTAGSAEILPVIAEAVGKATIVMVDGGVRSGADVLKMLALGAKYVYVGRPVAVAVHGDENEGLISYFAHIKKDLLHCMRMTGCRSVDNINSRVIC